MWHERTCLVLYGPALAAMMDGSTGHRICQLVNTLVSDDSLAGSPLSVWQRAEIHRKGVRNLAGLITRKHGVQIQPCYLLAGQST